MKAKEYYEKYHSEFTSSNVEDVKKAACGLMRDMFGELTELLKKRKARTASAIMGIVRELNDKYRAIVNLYETKDDIPFFDHEGFMKVCRDNIKGFSMLEDAVKAGKEIGVRL